MPIETIALLGSTLGALMALSGALWAATHPPRRQASDTVTITIEDAAGVRTRMVAHTRRPLNEVRRTVERAVADAR